MRAEGGDAVARHAAAALVMVQATRDAEAVCQKSNLSAVDVMRPYGQVDKIFHVSTVGEQYALRNFSMRFVHSSEFRTVDQANAERHLTRLMESYDCSSELSDAQASERSSLPVSSPSMPSQPSITTPWLSGFRTQLAVSLRHSDGASLDHPVGCVLLASVREPKLVNVFNSLASSATLAPVISDGSADPAMPRTYVLLHDVSDGASSDAEAQKALAEISRAFGPSACHLLPFNSRKPDESHAMDIWTAARPVMHTTPPTSAPNHLPSGSPISAEDADNVKKLVDGPIATQVGHLPSSQPPFRKQS